MLLVIGWVLTHNIFSTEEYSPSDRYIAQNNLNDPRVLKAILDLDYPGAGLPSWVSFGDMEKTVFINSVIEKLWPHIAKVVPGLVTEKVGPILQKSASAIKLETIDIGTLPLVIRGIKSYPTTRDEIVTDIDIAFISNSEFGVALMKDNSPMKVLLKNFSLSGIVRVMLEPLMDVIPCIGSVSISFVEKPRIRFDIDAMKMPVTSVPGFHKWLGVLVREQIVSMMLWPKRVTVPISGEEGDGSAPVAQRVPQGVLKVLVIEGTEFPKMDVIGKCDPLLKISLGEQEFETKAVHNTLRPKWNEQFEFEVFDLCLDHLVVSAYDVDVLEKEYIGKFEVSLSSLQPFQTKSLWMPFQDNPSGKVSLEMHYIPLNEPPMHPVSYSATEQMDFHDMDEHHVGENHETKEDVAPQTSTLAAQESSLSSASDNRFSPLKEGVDQFTKLYVTVCNVDLPAPKNQVFVTMRLGQQEKESTQKKRSSSPVFNEEFRFNVADMGTDVLYVAVWSQKLFQKKLLGEVKVQVKELPLQTQVDEDMNFSNEGGSIRLKMKVIQYPSMTRGVNQNMWNSGLQIK